MADPNLRQLTRHVLENTNADDWWWDRIASHVGNEELHSPSIMVSGRRVSLEIQVECPRWLTFLFPTVEVKVNGYAAGSGGKYTAMPWSTEARFLRYRYRETRRQNLAGRRSMVAEIERGV